MSQSVAPLGRPRRAARALTIPNAEREAAKVELGVSRVSRVAARLELAAGRAVRSKDDKREALRRVERTNSRTLPWRWRPAATRRGIDAHCDHYDLDTEPYRSTPARSPIGHPTTHDRLNSAGVAGAAMMHLASRTSSRASAG